MKTILLIANLFFILCSPVLAADWILFHKEGETRLFYDSGSYSCFRRFDRSSGTTLGYTATVWIKTTPPQESTKDNVKIWSIDCTARKIDKEGRDNIEIWGEHIRPDSLEEKLYKKICSICGSSRR
jgi:hypothetical protein